MATGSVRLADVDSFRQACLAYLETAHSAQLLGPHQYATGWEWQDALQSVLPNSAGLARTFPLLTSAPSSDLEGVEELTEDPDNTVEEAAPARSVVTVHQSIHWSNTWRVPVLYFYAHWSTGEPLSLPELTASRVIHSTGTLSSAMLPQKEEESYYAPVSYGDHPRSGLPCFYLHPCQTAEMLSSILPQEVAPHLYIEAFISLCASAIEMRA